MKVFGTLTSPNSGMVVDDTAIRGGYKVVANQAALVALRADTIKNGSHVYVIDTDRLYRKSGGDWKRVAHREVAIGDIQISAATISEAGWVLCNGAILDIASYPEAFAKFGTKWGGNGTTTFGIPNADDRSILGTGVKTLGAVGGAHSVTLTTAQLPAHAHTTSIAIPVVGGSNANQSTPGPTMWLSKIASLLGIVNAYHAGQPNTTLKPFDAVSGNMGSGSAVNTTPKYLALNVYIFIGPT